ncbi:RNA polymerase sigma-70 factor [Arcticibacter tournemirensis]|uniref:RNA polymerase sigma-70 factor n=1 Tax=Arcticibacter tournemirensis TaxID=699437 RepID=A0A4Q0MA88_9SPHI|nr:RNA polymerase sigma-70 factor [Arcticibacter tournemirensis]RXF70160.1 RNA polymerase sigma-70 factor [Arcticibacter tournemirensis]
MADYSDISEIALLGLLREDDQFAFNQIYKRYWKKLLMIAWNHSKNEAIAKDIVHEVFLSLWERRSEIEIKDLGAFLATSIKFTVFKYYQQESRHAKLVRENYIVQDWSEDEAKLDALFLKEFINGIVEEMPEKCRLVFKYSRDEGLKNSEIAEKISISEKGVEANLTRALKIIRHELKNAGLLSVAFYLLFRN